ncbi:MAG: hypothetical protein IJF25_04020 [Oscillospiraceae bacterium]|nr:hypothetical protein [Oscillospiraceae bacterium]
MLMYIYLVILAVLCILILRNMFKTNDPFQQFEAILVLIPFLMRLMRIK